MINMINLEREREAERSKRDKNEERQERVVLLAYFSSLHICTPRYTVRCICMCKVLSITYLRYMCG